MVELSAEAEVAKAALDPAYERLGKARRRWARTKSPADFAAMTAAEEEGQRLYDKFSAVVRAMEIASGLTADELDALEAEQNGDSAIVVDRNDLSDQKVRATLLIEDHLANSLDRIHQLLPKGWLESESAEQARIGTLTAPDAFLSLTKNLRRESEEPSIHRFRQAILVAADLLHNRPDYDLFAGAAIVPAIVQLGRELPLIENLRHQGNDRVKRLWAGPSSEVDSVMFELLVAAGCKEHGRSIEFIGEGSEKSADIRAHDPFRILIECKRQAGITNYELTEESVVREIFLKLRAACRKRGVRGTFTMVFSEECVRLDTHEVVEGTLAAISGGNGQRTRTCVKPKTDRRVVQRRTDGHRANRASVTKLGALDDRFDHTSDRR